MIEKDAKATKRRSNGGFICLKTLKKILQYVAWISVVHQPDFCGHHFGSLELDGDEFHFAGR